MLVMLPAFSLLLCVPLLLPLAVSLSFTLPLHPLAVLVSFSVCNTGYGDCDKNATNGCETNLNADGNHCGTCSTVCRGNDHCSSGTCGEFRMILEPPFLILFSNIQNLDSMRDLTMTMKECRQQCKTSKEQE
jgi:hypothetical protein